MTGSVDKRRGARPLGALVGRELTPSCRRRGLADGTLLLAWEDVVPGGVATECWVERIDWPRERRAAVSEGTGAAPATRGATLVVGATPGAALVLSHATAELVARINAVFGWRAVERVKILRKAAPPAEARPARPAPPGPEAVAAARAHAEGIGHEKLKRAVIRLGANVLARSSRRGEGAP